MAFYKRAIGFVTSLALSLSPALSLADDCTSQVIKQQVEKAATSIEQKGEAAFEELKSHRYCGEQGYIFVQDVDGIMLFHPFLPNLVGKNVASMKDANGKLFGLELLDQSKAKGEAWVSYKWARPGESVPADKCTYLKKVTWNGKDLLVGSGLYDIQESSCGK
jgi:signal transduction histidine kinase